MRGKYAADGRSHGSRNAQETQNGSGRNGLPGGIAMAAQILWIQGEHQSPGLWNGPGGDRLHGLALAQRIGFADHGESQIRSDVGNR